MQNDKTTLRDLSIFGNQGEDISSLIDRCTTSTGREYLRSYIRNPPDTYDALLAMQEVIRWWSLNEREWTTVVSNGTIVMLEKFYEAADGSAQAPGEISMLVGNFFQRFLNRNEYSFIQFSLTHLSDFLKGMQALSGLIRREELPAMLRNELELVAKELDHRLVPELVAIDKKTPYKQLARLAFRARRELKNPVQRLLLHYARLDCWQGLGRATAALGWVFPTLHPALPVVFKATGLHHPLLSTPVSYEIGFDAQQHFLLLTGANMSGKTTFMRSLGVAALLSHLGMGAPAATMEISFLQGVITNMHVEDNILRGESYFFAEVQRMKSTARRIVGEQPQLVLMDELFKGTNVHDAYECTRAVVDGLLHHPRHLMVLSTHIHEVAHHFEERGDILFAYFVTTMSEDGSFRFTYELRPGISNDRIGYRILRQEGIIDLLTKG
jgi:DNA mismatch repair ATPase MutS